MAESRTDEDYRVLARGELERARRRLAGLEARRARIPLDGLFLVVAPPLTTALPAFGSRETIPLLVASLTLGISMALLKYRKELADPKERPTKTGLCDLIRELEAVPSTGPLDAWSRRVIDEAPEVLRRLLE
jgi:hypothetical protein